MSPLGTFSDKKIRLHSFLRHGVLGAPAKCNYEAPEGGGVEGPLRGLSGASGEGPL